MVTFTVCKDDENMYDHSLGMDIDALKEKGKELWELIVKLETEKYDLEEKVKRQDYDVSSSHNSLNSMIIFMFV